MNDEQTIAIVSFSGAIKREIVKVKRKLAQASEKIELNEFSLTIKANGRVNDGDIKIEFLIADGQDPSWAPNKVIGNNLDAILEEFLRRKGWNIINQPLMLTVNEQAQADADRVVTPQPETPEQPEPDGPF